MSDMFFRAEIEKEIHFNKNHAYAFKSELDFDEYMKDIESSRSSIYNHTLSQDCIEKGITIIII